MRTVTAISPLALALLASCASTPEPASSTTAWFTITQADGQAIGYASQDRVTTPGGQQIVSDQVLDLAEGKSVPARAADHRVLREDGAGRMVSMSLSATAEGSWSKTEIRFSADQASVTRDTADDHKVTMVTLNPSVRLDGDGGALLSWNPVTTPRLMFDAFNPDAAAVEHVVIEADTKAPPAPGGQVWVIRRAYDGDQVVSLSRLLLDQGRHVVASAQPMFGSTITVRPSDKRTALTPHAAYQVLTSAATKSPYRIPDAAFQGHIRYEFAFKDGLDFTLPQTGEQRTVVGPDGVTVDICQDCGPGLPADRASLDEDLKPTAWMQSDNPRLKAIARPVSALPVTDAEKMEALARITRRTLDQVDYVGHYSALETLSRRSGDCTEAAVLLAALGRSAGIPTKVVSGLVYSRPFYHGVSNVFLPHSWVLAYADGKWRSFDAALETFDMTHIALSVGDGDQRSIGAAGELGSLLRWDSMTEVKAAPLG